MPNPVQSGPVHGKDQISTVIKSIQAAVGVPVNIGVIDGQHMAAKIIAMQKQMVVNGKMTSNQVNLSIDDQHLSAKLAQIQAAL